jgi:hypothetical protein
LFNPVGGRRQRRLAALARVWEGKGEGEAEAEGVNSTAIEREAA